MGSSPDFYFVGFHRFLDQSSKIAQSDVDASLPNPCIRGIFYCLKQVVVHGVKSNCEGRVDDPSIDMRTEIYFHHIVFP